MKKVISITLVFIIAMFACIGAFAETGSSNMIDIDHVTVIFEEDSMFTPEEQQYIAEMLVYGNENATTLGIGCLFGHKYVEENVSMITHCVNPTDPRCLQEKFFIQTCSRCGKTNTEIINSKYISCCP